MSTLRRLSLKRAFSLLALAALVPLASACTNITGLDGELRGEQRDLSRARRTWSSTSISDYEFVVRRDCFCTLGGVAVRVVVQNYIVVSREIDGTSTPIPSSLGFLYPSIDGLFSVIQNAIDTRAYQIDTQYDDRYGFPTDVWIDYNQRTADEEEGYTLIRFRSLR